MSRVTLTGSAIDQLIRDRQYKPSIFDGGDGGRALLAYYRRSYTTLPDGTVREHGDGFAVTTTDLGDERMTKSVVFQSVAVAKEFEILVGGEPSVLSQDFTIDWTGARFTFEPDETS